jgi:predicted nucleic-acid-binding protein
MRMIDTVVLIGYINPLDSRNAKATQYMNEVWEGEDLLIPSASLMELDLELKTHAVSDKDRITVFSNLARIIPPNNILSLTPATFEYAARLAGKAKWRGAYFDTLIASTAMEHGVREVITTDRKFEKFGLRFSF